MKNFADNIHQETGRICTLRVDKKPSHLDRNVRVLYIRGNAAKVVECATGKTITVTAGKLFPATLWGFTS